MKISANIKNQLDFFADKYNNLQFIAEDPISIPHRFQKLQDIEISAFISAMIAWGNRTTIINSANAIIEGMDNAPFDFIMHHQEKDLARLAHCKHRTFQFTDLLYFIHFLKYHYTKNNSLESAFCNGNTMEKRLINFHQYFFSLPEAPDRTRKHVSTPAKKSACKRLNMFLRWMVRKDQNGVDFGIWKNLKPSELIIPLDVHVIKSIEEIFNVPLFKPNWNNAVEITALLSELNPSDPVIYDYALFGYSINKKK